MELLKTALRPSVQLLRAASVHSELALQAGQGGAMAVFLPAYGQHGAALLRIYNIAHALRLLGWRTLVVPWKLTLKQRHRILASACPDVVVMQGSRHMLNHPAYYPGYKIVYDIDDADFHLPHLAGAVRRAMAEVDVVVAGSAYIADWCRSAGAKHVEVVWTGAPVSRAPRPPQASRPPVIAWAQTRPQTYIHEAAWVRNVIAELGRLRPGVTLRLFDRQPGDDPGFADSFVTAGVTVEWIPAQSYAGYLRALDDVALGFAPLAPETPFSWGKSFGKILGYLDRHVPVVASDIGEPATFFNDATGVLSNLPGVWSAESKRLLDDVEARSAMVKAARAAYESQLSTSASANAIERVLRSCLK